MPKARMVLAALQRDGWLEVRRKGSHRILKKGRRAIVWAFHDGTDLGNEDLRRIARQAACSLEDLRRIL